MKLLFAGLLISGCAFADAVTDWNAIMRAAVRAEGAHVQSRIAAITQIAVFDAVNTVERRYRPYLPNVAPAPGASAEAAAIAAAHKVLTALAPAQLTMLDGERARTLAEVADGPAKTAGVAAGETVAAAILAFRASDGAATPVPYTPLSGPGQWQPTPPAYGSPVGTNWAVMTPFAMKSGDQFRPGPPPDLDSPRYTRDYNEVKEMGAAASTARPDDRTQLARYMALTSPTQIWNEIAVQLSAAEGANLVENAHILALMNMAVADAAIAVFDAKYHYGFWRPLTAIRAGDTDGNARTEADPAFTSLLNAPAYPSYPSGYGAFSNAARMVLEQVFGRRRQSLQLLANPSLPDMNLRYTRMRDLTDDIADARVYGGIHFRFEQDEAEDLGESVGRYVMQTQLLTATAGGRSAGR